MIKKNHTFATEIGPIVQWIPACRQAGNGGFLMKMMRDMAP